MKRITYYIYINSENGVIINKHCQDGCVQCDAEKKKGNSFRTRTAAHRFWRKIYIPLIDKRNLQIAEINHKFDTLIEKAFRAKGK